MGNEHVKSVISITQERHNADKKFLPFSEVSHHGVTFYKSQYDVAST